MIDCATKQKCCRILIVNSEIYTLQQEAATIAAVAITTK